MRRKLYSPALTLPQRYSQKTYARSSDKSTYGIADMSRSRYDSAAINIVTSSSRVCGVVIALSTTISDIYHRYVVHNLMTLWVFIFTFPDPDLMNKNIGFLFNNTWIPWSRQISKNSLVVHWDADCICSALLILN